jgi:hypothetical protein
MYELLPGHPGSPARNRVFVPVPWHGARSISKSLRKQGITAVACYDPLDRRATIEIGQDADLRSVQDLLIGAQK